MKSDLKSDLMKSNRESNQMKSYLSLIPISAKVHRRQNRMTLLCIIFAVFLVTAIFSMAEMGVRMEQTRVLAKHGSLTLQDLLGNPMAQTLFLTAGVLFLLVLAAGVLMISGSINSNVAQRTKFFGMMRCIGMSKEQITHFVKLEALSWCKTAIPIGVVLGIAATWGLCAALRFLVGEEFTNIPLFSVSTIGILSGVAVGMVTVLLAARAPAKRAARVSPVAAVSGNSENANQHHRAVSTRFFKIETALGIHHALSAKKNLLLMTGSFALSIILFLCFTVLIELIGFMMPQSASDAELTIVASNGTQSIAAGVADTLRGMAGVKRVFGRRSCLKVPAEPEQGAALFDTVDLISFDDFELECLVKDCLLKKGSDLAKVTGNGSGVLATWDKTSTLAIGDTIRIGGETLEIAGLLTLDPFSSDGMTNGTVTLITSGDTFRRLTGITDYSLLMVQTERDVTDEEVAALRSRLGGDYTLIDNRDQRTAGTYTAFTACVYGFLAVIALVSALNSINSISMSVSARIKQYGTMRAVGMDEHQLTKMVVAQALTYAVAGCLVGCGMGLLLHRFLYHILIDGRYPYAVWSVPVVPLAVVLGFVSATVIAATYAPTQRLRGISVIETINEL